MSNTPAQPSNTLDEILQSYHGYVCHSGQLWIKGQTERFPCDCALGQAKQAIALAIEAILGDDYYCPKFEQEVGTRICGYCGEYLHQHIGLLQRQRAAIYLNTKGG